ncbi:ABC transporter permease [Pedobacter sp. KR3-3]|uniref:ABC transporter permease n=1 Tax=Pedobacter albus TaxID=3113905 RepID=A0ABU7I684_9SPHI|nr:ABC transporter permease [Pedobacter sp. KR3-3]MEE1944816.1 ABC transporter permease [Pedobacter sp. KR3-3]
MFRLNLKIALRNLWKNRNITAINIGGLSIALAAFMLIMIYVAYETSFDKDNPNYDNIYLVGRKTPAFTSNYTSPPLSKEIKQNFPEVEAVGKMKSGGFEFAINSDKSTVFVQKLLFAEYEAAKMLNIKPLKGLEEPAGGEFLFYLNESYMATLFPDKNDQKPNLVTMGNKTSGQSGVIKGAVFANPHSNISFDGISIAKEIGVGEPEGYNNYFTYIQVKPGTDVEALRQKIEKMYRVSLAKADTDPDWKYINATNIYLDPLKNLHLRPTAGTDTNYKVLIALSVLGFLMLLIACINFTNLSIAQATKRAKEVGVKKVMGAFRTQLTFQFLIEILMQCVVATIFALILAELVLPKFNSLFEVNLVIWQRSALLWQLPLVLMLLTLVAGVYPAMVLSGFKPALVLKGNFQTSRQSYWLKNGLLVLQFGIAVIFIIGLLVINSQLKYMRTQDVGFKPDQVVRIKNMAVFSDPAVFEPVRNQMMQIPGVKSVTVANGIPDGSKTGINGYTVDGKNESINMLSVDFDYFETLDIKIKEGRFFSRNFAADTANSAILNESAIAKYGLTNPIGKIIRGCSTDYRIVGVIKDFKADGFETAVAPTIYTIKDPCSNAKLDIMVKIEENQMASALAMLKAKWPTINKKDGDNFRYQFLDELYGRLFKKQEQLQSVFFAAAILTIFIAVLGLFAFAKYITAGRMKEIAVRKILGASDLQILKLLNSSFFVIVVVANLLAWPLAYLITKKWLETFAYRVDVPMLPFALSALITIGLAILTVSLQANKSVKANPVDALKYE